MDITDIKIQFGNRPTCEEKILIRNPKFNRK